MFHWNRRIRLEADSVGDMLQLVDKLLSFITRRPSVTSSSLVDDIGTVVIADDDRLAHSTGDVNRNWRLSRGG